MKLQPRQLVIALVIAVVALAVWSLWFVGDEARIRRVLTEIAEAGSVGPEEDQLTEIGQARAVASHFTETCEIEAPEERALVRGRSELTQHVVMARSTLGPCAVSFGDVSISVEDGTATASGTIHVTSPGGEALSWDGTRIEARFVRDGRDWLIEHATVQLGPER